MTTTGRFLLALLAIPLFGLGLGRRILPASSGLFLRLGFGGAAGTVLLGIEMLAFSWLGVPWSVVILCLPPVALLLVGRTRPSRSSRAPSTESALPFDAGLAFAALATMVLVTVTSRATGGDFLLFWATKGEHFAMARSIDDGFLRDPFHLHMHPNYPPLVPLLYAWGCLAAGRMSWVGALCTLPLFLGLAGCAFLGYAATRLGRRQATALTAVLLAMLGLATIAVPVGGNAEPLLLFFETVSLSALLFGPPGVARELAAGLGLAGTAMTKVEGSVFAALVIGAHLLFGRDRSLKSFLRLAAPPAVVVVVWFLYCRTHGLPVGPDVPAGSGADFFLVVGREMARHASFGIGFVPWIAVLAVGVGRRSSPESRTAAAVAIGFVLSMAVVYVRAPQDPTLWILWSAGRLFMTPLLCAFFAAAARYPRVPDAAPAGQPGSATTTA